MSHLISSRHISLLSLVKSRSALYLHGANHLENTTMSHFYTPVWKTDVLCRGNVVCPSVSLQLMTSCYMNFAIIIQWIYFTIWKKIKKNHHHYNTILSLYNIISRHYKKSLLLRSQIYHGYEELSTDTNYPMWRRRERRSKYAVQLASWQLRSNSPKT